MHCYDVAIILYCYVPAKSCTVMFWQSLVLLCSGNYHVLLCSGSHLLLCSGSHVLLCSGSHVL